VDREPSRGPPPRVASAPGPTPGGRGRQRRSRSAGCPRPAHLRARRPRGFGGAHVRLVIRRDARALPNPNLIHVGLRLTLPPARGARRRSCRSRSLAGYAPPGPVGRPRRRRPMTRALQSSGRHRKAPEWGTRRRPAGPIWRATTRADRAGNP
jgi:hypothetical protein